MKIRTLDVDKNRPSPWIDPYAEDRRGFDVAADPAHALCLQIEHLQAGRGVVGLGRRSDERDLVTTREDAKSRRSTPVSERASISAFRAFNSPVSGLKRCSWGIRLEFLRWNRKLPSGRASGMSAFSSSSRASPPSAGTLKIFESLEK